MAVYKRTYKGYSGPLTPGWQRFLILPRSSYGRVFQSKFLVVYLAACFFFPVLCAAFIYLSHNLSFLGTFGIPQAKLFEINGRFFEFFCGFQGGMASLLTAFVGPGLVAPDLANNALPLYLSRPFSRFEYAVGRMSLLAALLSLITWVPGLILFGIQASLAGGEWTGANLWIAGSILAGMLVWDVFLSLLALALSAWVKWKIAAGALILGVFFAGAGFGSAFNAIVRTQYGSLLDLRQVISIIWAHMFRDVDTNAIALGPAWAALALAAAICVWLLARRIKPFEVVR